MGAGGAAGAAAGGSSAIGRRGGTRRGRRAWRRSGTCGPPADWAARREVAARREARGWRGMAGAAGQGGAAGARGGGGKGGKGGAGGTAGGGAGGSNGECTQPSDCVLHNDCCACAAMPKNAAVASCNLLCLIASCTAQSVTAADVTCVAGRCVLNRSCNAANVTCATAPPTCAAGSLPIVTNHCYAGGCLPASQCADVGSCDACTAAGLSCVTYDARTGPTYHCVTIPAACSGAPTCACLGVCTGTFECVPAGEHHANVRVPELLTPRLRLRGQQDAADLGRGRRLAGSPAAQGLRGAAARDGAVACGRDRHALVAQVQHADVVLRVSPGRADAGVRKEHRAALGPACDTDRTRRAGRPAACRVHATLATAAVTRSSAAGLATDGAASTPAVTARPAFGPAAPSGLAATPARRRARLSTAARRTTRVTATAAHPSRRAATTAVATGRASAGAARRGAARPAGPRRRPRIGSAGTQHHRRDRDERPNGN